MKFKKIFYLFVVLIFLTACKNEKSHVIRFSTGEVYKFETLSVEVIADEEKMTTREIFSSKDNGEKLDEIINLLIKCKVVDQGYSYASIPDHNSLLINLHNKDEEIQYICTTQKEIGTQINFTIPSMESLATKKVLHFYQTTT